MPTSQSTRDLAAVLREDLGHTPSLDSAQYSYLYRQSRGYRAVRFLLRDAPASPCPSCRPLWGIDLATGHVWPLRCRRWTCPFCRVEKTRLVRRLLREGMAIAQQAGK